MKKLPLEERFWAKVDKRAPSDCWFWRGAPTSRGYGGIKVNGKTQSAHRVSWMLRNGPIPQLEGSDYRGTCVLHQCDTPLCVNPDHLFLGTAADNMADMTTKGRHVVADQHGEKHAQARLTEGAVRMIRKYYDAGGCTYKWLGQIYGVRGCQIGKIVRRETWSQI